MMHPDDIMEILRTERRRERNRQHAKLTRLRKRLQMEGLAEEEAALRNENARLKLIMKEKCSAALFTGKTSSRNDGDEPPAAKMDAKDDAGVTYRQTDFHLIESLAAHKQSYVITDPRLPDNPIVYASDRFCTLTGYQRDQVVGRNCRFLQGSGTEDSALEVVRRAIFEGTDCTTVILNYKADGTPFWNRLFLAALRDWEGNIVNFVGLQCEEIGPNAHLKETALPSLLPTSPVISMEASRLNAQCIEAVRKERVMALESNDDDVFMEELDWSILAEAFEADFVDIDNAIMTDSTAAGEMSFVPPESALVEGLGEGTLHSWPIPMSTYGLEATTCSTNNAAPTSGTRDYICEATLKQFRSSPLAFTTKTVRSELIDALLASHGDVNDPRFVSALSVLSTIYKSSGQNASSTNLYNGTWRSISRPHYSGCLGQNKRGEFMYTLGTLSWDMFAPGDAQCSVQRTLSHIETVCPMDGAPSAAPWSLRRELAAINAADKAPTKHTVLKSYSIAVALTIEPDHTPGQEQKPSSRLRALNVTQGYMIPDPTTPNRLTVWFTGGKLSPALPPNQDNLQTSLMDSDNTSSTFGGLTEWKALFGSKQSRTWGESFRVMGAKLLLGAELLPGGIGTDGTMRYILHRPVGGHGRAYVDVAYLDDDLLILRSNWGIVHVMIRAAESQT